MDYELQLFTLTNKDGNRLWRFKLFLLSTFIFSIQLLFYVVTDDFESHHLGMSFTMPDAPVLPPDLVVEILSCLPVKALMRFKCVSKTWNSLMFDPTFIKLHLQRSQKNTYLVFLWSDVNLCTLLYTEPCSVRTLLENPLPTVDYDNCPRIYNSQISDNYFFMGVCNGLVGIISYVWEKGFEEGFIEYWFRFWNPATRVISSQDSPHTRVYPSNYEFGHVFYHGIGYDDQNDTYKVVTIHLDVKSQLTEVRVYTLGGTCWKNVLNCPTFHFLQEAGASLNGTINWIVVRNPNINDAYHYWETITTINDIAFFSYDLKNETYKLLLMPKGLSEVPSQPPDYGVLNGCLCLSHEHKGTHFVVWLMRELGVESSWTQLLNVSFEHLQIIDGLRRITMCMPICMSENEDVLLLKTDACEKFIIYNRRSNRIDRIGDINNNRYSNSFQHVQSLVLPY